MAERESSSAPQTIEKIHSGGEPTLVPLAGYPQEFQVLIAKMEKHRFTPVIEERGDGSVRMWTKERGSDRSIEALSPTDAARELSRDLRAALYQHTTVEPDEAFERQLQEEGRDHDLDIPMRPDEQALQDAHRELYDVENRDGYEPERDEDFERE